MLPQTEPLMTAGSAGDQFKRSLFGGSDRSGDSETSGKSLHPSKACGWWGGGVRLVLSASSLNLAAALAVTYAASNSTTPVVVYIPKVDYVPPLDLFARGSTKCCTVRRAALL